MKKNLLKQLKIWAFMFSCIPVFAGGPPVGTPGTCPTFDYNVTPTICSGDDIQFTAGPGCFVDVNSGFQVYSYTGTTSYGPIIINQGDDGFTDLNANNPGLNSVNVSFELACNDFGYVSDILVSGPRNPSCEPINAYFIFVGVDMIGDDDNDGNENIIPTCDFYELSTVVLPEPTFPVAVGADCSLTITGACPNDLVTVTSANPGTLSGDGTNAVTYTPNEGDGAQTITVSVDNGTNDGTVDCSTQTFEFDLPAYPVASLTNPGDFCSDDAGTYDITGTPESGEFAFGSLTINLVGDGFSSQETTIQVFNADGSPVAPAQPVPSGASSTTFTDIQLNTTPAAPGTYTVGTNGPSGLFFTIADAYGDGMNGGSCTPGDEGTYEVVDGAGNILVPLQEFEGSLDPGGGNANCSYAIYPTGTNTENYNGPIAVDYVITTVGTFGGPGVNTDQAGDIGGSAALENDGESTFTPSVAGPGEHGLTYTFEDQLGCEDIYEVYVDVYEPPVLSQATTTCNTDGTYNATIPASNISTATWNEILDAAAVGSDLGNTPTIGVNDPNNPMIGAVWTNDGIADGVATSFTVSATLGTVGSTTINADGTITVSNIPTGSTSTLTVGAGNENAGCHTSLVINPPCLCPVITDNNANYCDGTVETGGVDLATWAAAVATANPTTTPVNSTIVAVDGTTPPDGLTISTTATDACASETQTQYIYEVCDNILIGDTSDDTYILLGTYIATVYPAIQAPTVAVNPANSCEITITGACTGDLITLSNQTVATGVISNNGTNVVTYTAQPADVAGMVNIDIVSGIAGSICTYTTSMEVTPACQANCPTAVTVTDDTGAVCSGGGTDDFATWQGSITTANPLDATQDPGGSGSIAYSSIMAVDGTTAPDGLIPDGTHSGIDNCLDEDYTVFAYLVCDTNGDSPGTITDDTYQLISTYTLTVNPLAQDPTPSTVACSVSLTAACTNDVYSAPTNPTGDALASNFDAGTGVYTAQSGDLAGTLDITVSNEFGCTKTYTITTPACPAGCPLVVDVMGADALCSGDLTTEITTWQTNVSADTDNAAAIADVNTDAAVVYSSVIVDGVAVTMPDGNIADGIHSGTDNCVTETQITYAYLLCYGTDATSGTADDSYLLLGTHTLTVNPLAQDPTPSTVACSVSLTAACTNDVYSAPTNPTGDALASNFDAGTGVYTAQSGDLAGTLDITVSNEFGCTKTYTITTPACPAGCPLVVDVMGADALCSGDLTTEITTWQTNVSADTDNAAAIADVNTDAAVVYSSVIVDGVAVTMPDGNIADGIHSGTDNCVTETQITYAYLLCYGTDATSGTADDSYLLLGTHTLTVNPLAQNPTPSTVGCSVSLTAACTNDVYSAPTNPTGDALASNFDAGTGVYTAQSGDLAGTLDITVSNEFGCTKTYTITTPACPAGCPLVVDVMGADALCSGDLTTEITTWQTNVSADTDNAAAIADVNTDAAVVYSSVIVDGVAVTMPDGNIADGIHSGTDNCVTETQITYAYLLCYGTDATSGTADDSYLLLGTHTLTVNPLAQDPTPSTVGCSVSLTAACTNDVYSAPTNPTGDALASNFDAGTGVYTAQSGDLAGTLDITVSNEFGCTKTYTITTPACPAGCPLVVDVMGADALCSGALTTEITTWQTNVSADTDNAAAIADVNTDGAVIFSTDAPAGVSEAVPPTASTPNGVNTSCIPEVQISYAYLLCYGTDAAAGGGDDSYLLLGTHTLTVYPVLNASVSSDAANTCGDVVIDLMSDATICNSQTVSCVNTGDVTTVTFTDVLGADGTGNVTSIIENPLGSCNTLVVSGADCSGCEPPILILEDPCDCSNLITVGNITYALETITITPGLAPYEVTVVNNLYDNMGNLYTSDTPGVPGSGTASAAISTVGGVTTLTGYVIADGSTLFDLTIIDANGTTDSVVGGGPCDCICEEEITFEVIASVCDMTGATIELQDDLGNTITSIPLGDEGGSGTFGVQNCGNYQVVIVNAPSCYTDTGTDVGPRALTVDGIGTTNVLFITPQDIPTLSEWGLITLALLLMCFGSIVMVGNAELVTTSNIKLGKNYQIPVNSSILNTAFLLTSILVIIGFTTSLIFFGAIFVSDIIGVAIAGPVFAYLIHILIVLEKGNN